MRNCPKERRFPQHIKFLMKHFGWKKTCRFLLSGDFALFTL
jgi:hypothetical protein